MQRKRNFIVMKTNERGEIEGKASSGAANTLPDVIVTDEGDQFDVLRWIPTPPRNDTAEAPKNQAVIQANIDG